MRTIGILTKPHSANHQPVLTKITDWLTANDKDVLVSTPTKEDLAKGIDATRAQIARDAELLMVLGGDGTMLHGARLVQERSVPILGVNMGGLGFLTETTVDRLFESLEKIFAGQYVLDQRLMLKADIHRGQRIIGSAIALNDIVINKGSSARMISTKVDVNQTFMNNLRGDGLIIATPTGSTAYSLSASGPILDPSLETFIINPVCPHTLSHRPYIAPSHATISVTLVSPEAAIATFDGQIVFDIVPGDAITICAAEHRAQLIRFRGSSYYDVLRNKLKWGDG